MFYTTLVLSNDTLAVQIRQCVNRFNNVLLLEWQVKAILKIQYYRLINFLLKQQSASISLNK